MLELRGAGALPERQSHVLPDMRRDVDASVVLDCRPQPNMVGGKAHRVRRLQQAGRAELSGLGGQSGVTIIDGSKVAFESFLRLLI